MTYCVTFLPNGGTGTAPVMADMAAGGTFRLPANPFHREGYQFSGWTYAITAEKSEHGQVTASRNYASSGTTVRLIVSYVLKPAWD